MEKKSNELIESSLARKPNVHVSSRFLLSFLSFLLSSRTVSLTDVINSNRSRGEGLVGTAVRVSEALVVL